MGLADVFLFPLGLVAVLAAVPIILLYLVRPEPSRLELPTFRFLSDAEREDASRPVWERLSRSLLLIIQLMAILVFAVAIASPYVSVAESESVEETVIVVDDSASMATLSASGSRFAEAIAVARDRITGRTSVVTTAGGRTVALQRGSPGDAQSVLDGLEVTDSPGDLRRAIAQAGALAGENSRVVVLSDFVGDDWADAVSTLRARGLIVSLERFGAGGDANVGFIDRRFRGSSVTLSVQNFGSEAVTRTVELGDRSDRVSLGPGDVRTTTLPVPAGGGEARLSGGDDDFQTDDRVYIAAPADLAVDVLVLTNDRNRFLTTALDVLDQVDLSVSSPPTTVGDGYDVIVYSNVDPAALLPGNVEAGRALLADGGGVAVQAQRDFPDRYGNLSLIDPIGLFPTQSVRTTVDSDLTRGINFQPPDEILAGDLRAGEALVEMRDGSPLIATAERADGRLLYYGYIEASSTFKYNYQYPVFWKRAIFHLAGREPLTRLNHVTGDTVSVREGVVGPDGQATGPTVELLDAGYYEGDIRRSASLLDAAESAVASAPLSDRSATARTAARSESRTVPWRLTPFVALAVVVVLLVEVAYVRRRGDL